MDGLTVRAARSVLDQGQTLKEIRNDQMAPAATGIGGTTEGKSFADTLKDAVQSVNTAQKESDVKMQELATGKNHNVADVMITSEKADLSLKLMVQVRNKIIEAYQEIMKMQV